MNITNLIRAEFKRYETAELLSSMSKLEKNIVSAVKAQFEKLKTEKTVAEEGLNLMKTANKEFYSFWDIDQKKINALNDKIEVLKEEKHNLLKQIDKELKEDEQISPTN